MTDASLNEINRTLGALTATVERALVSSDHKADQHRSNVHLRLDDMLDQTGEIERRLNHLEGRVAAVDKSLHEDVMPMVTEVRIWKQRGVGALFMAGIAGSFVGAGCAWLWQAIAAKVMRLGQYFQFRNTRNHGLEIAAPLLHYCALTKVMTNLVGRLK